MSTRITKTIAEAVANQLSEPKKQEIKEVQASMATFITSKWIDAFPPGLLSSFSKFREFFNTTSSVRIHGAGLSQGYKYYQLTDAYPFGSKNLELKDKDAFKVVQFEDDIEAKTKDYNALKTAITLALINLRTYEKVKVEFPEAYELLPMQQKSAIAINLKDIRCQLDSSNC